MAVLDTPTSALRVRNDRPSAVQVMGSEGEVFARIGPRGAEVNVRSPVWLATAQHRGRDLLTSVIDAAAAPQFLVLSKEPELIWPDPRLLPRTPLPVVRRGQRTAIPLARWSVPIRTGGGGEHVAVRGSAVIAQSAVEGVPTQLPAAAPDAEPDDGSGGSSALLLFGLAGAVALLCGAALLLRSRR